MGIRFGWWCCVVVVWVCCTVRAETIHFTNSPKLIMASKNYTTYELEVPGSKPITIIEATDPNDRSDTFPSDSLEHVGPAATTSFRTSTGISVSRPAQSDDSPSGAGGSHAVRKTLYSPELLNKFLKEYSEKLRNADSLTRKRLSEITMINGVNHGPKDPGPDDEERVGNEGQERNKMHRPQQNQSSGVEAASPNDGAKTEDEFVFEDTHERHGMLGAGSGNKRWYQDPGPGSGYHQLHGQSDGQKSHPWNVKDGWVTLEAVPWSESKVSKWHAATVSEANRHRAPGKGSYPPQQSLGNYWSDENDEEPAKYKPAPAQAPSPSSSIGASSYYHDGPSSDDEFGAAYGGNRREPSVNHHRLPSNPGESLYNRRRPPLAYSDRPDRPGAQTQPLPQDGWYEHQLQSSPYDSMKAYHEPGPTVATHNRDIITDGRPANFPKFAPDQPTNTGYGTTTAPPQALRGRPVSYPDHGNGEWVLISTTKGYQYPKRRHGQRAITFSPASSTSHQTVKLTVLPMKNAIDMTTSHNGLIEVSSSTQTVEDAVKQTQKQTKNKPKRQPPAASSAKRKKQQSGQSVTAATYSVMRRDAAQDSSAVLAAVGAGMVPATMAILAPMVLGRKKK